VFGDKVELTHGEIWSVAMKWNGRREGCFGERRVWSTKKGAGCRSRSVDGLYDVRTMTSSE
jgi:hypothetical protein